MCQWAKLPNQAQVSSPKGNHKTNKSTQNKNASRANYSKKNIIHLYSELVEQKDMATQKLDSARTEQNLEKKEYYYDRAIHYLEEARTSYNKVLQLCRIERQNEDTETNKFVALVLAAPKYTKKTKKFYQTY